MREFETEMRVREIEQTINEATHRSAQLALRAMRRRAAADELCGRTTAAVHCGARPMDCGMCGGAVGCAWRLIPQVWASIVKNGCMILQNRGFAKETLTKEITDKCERCYIGA